jgi:hypothetical protein
MTLPHPSAVKPDEVLSVNDAVAVLDDSYSKVSRLCGPMTMLMEC